MKNPLPFSTIKAYYLKLHSNKELSEKTINSWLEDLENHMSSTNDEGVLLEIRFFYLHILYNFCVDNQTTNISLENSLYKTTDELLKQHEDLIKFPPKNLGEQRKNNLTLHISKLKDLLEQEELKKKEEKKEKIVELDFN